MVEGGCRTALRGGSLALAKMRSAAALKMSRRLGPPACLTMVTAGSYRRVKHLLSVLLLLYRETSAEEEGRRLRRVLEEPLLPAPHCRQADAALARFYVLLLGRKNAPPFPHSLEPQPPNFLLPFCIIHYSFLGKSNVDVDSF